MKWARGWCVLVSAALALAVSAQERLPDTPENHYLYHATARLTAEGLYPTSTDGFGNGRPTETAKLAKAFVGAVDSLRSRFQERLKDSLVLGLPTAEHRKNCRDEIAFYSGEWRQLFRSMVPPLGAAIRQQGRDPAELLRRIDMLQPLASEMAQNWRASLKQAGGQPAFPDVPFTHWAADAVQELRDVGILIGYPRGTFVEGRSWAAGHGRPPCPVTSKHLLLLNSGVQR